MIYFTPGPSQIYPTVKFHLAKAIQEGILSISHRSDKFHEIVTNINKLLKKLLKIPDNYQIFFLSSATECMERIIQNCVEKHSFHLVNGAFSKRFYTIANDLKKTTQLIETAYGKGFEFRNLIISGNNELIAITQNETSTGVAINTDDIYYLHEKYKRTLFAIDITSSVPYINLDFTHLDCVFFSVQKGFGLPAGLGVLVLSPKALKKAQLLEVNGKNVGSYHKFSTMLNQAKKQQTVETPNILNLYLFEKVLEDMLRAKIEKIRKLTDQKAEMLYDYFEEHPEFEIFVNDRKIRSKTVVVLNTKKPPLEIILRLKEKGYLIGSGYGEFKNNQLRIANFPAHTFNDTRKLLKHFTSTYS